MGVRTVAAQADLRRANKLAQPLVPSLPSGIRSVNVDDYPHASWLGDHNYEHELHIAIILRMSNMPQSWAPNDAPTRMALQRVVRARLGFAMAWAAANGFDLATTGFSAFLTVVGANVPVAKWPLNDVRIIPAHLQG